MRNPLRRGAICLWTALLAVTEPVSAQPAPAPAWKPFQEFAFLVGAWSGTAESGPRIGGRVTRFGTEMGGNYLVGRGSTVFPALSGQPEETSEETSYVVYDREKRKYVAVCYFSSGVVGHYDVEFPAEGTVRFTSTQLLNFENGGRSRLTITRRSDAEISYLLEVAPGGKDYVTYISSRMNRK